MESELLPQLPVTLLIDVALAVIVLETLVLAVLARGHGPSSQAARRCLPTLAAGIFLMIAVSAVARGAAWPWVAGALTGAGIAHLWDLRRRWRER